MNDRHTVKTSEIANQIRKFYEAKKPFRIFHGSTNSTRILTFRKDELVDLSKLNEVIKVNPKSSTAIVESNVPMDKLVRATLKHGLLPPIVMEFPGITVRGAIQGNGGESSSFKWGAFNQTFNWHELILTNGEIIKASPDSDQDLFYAVPGSAGTLGVLTSAEVQLIKARKYVELHYLPVTNFAQAKKVLEEQTSRQHDFIDGIMFSAKLGVVIVGKLTDSHKHPLRRFSRAHDEWYYLHVEKTLSMHAKGWRETVPIKDYLFRYDRGAFWVGRFAFKIFDVPFTRKMRWLLDPILHTRKLYQALQESGASQQHIVQDLVLPANKAVDFMKFSDRELGTYPLWLCPMKVDTSTPFQLNNLPVKSIINIGLWGDNIADYDEFVRINKRIETKVLELGGKKWSYAHSYFSEKEFWSMYDLTLYKKLRKKYHATTLPTIYDKITVKKRYPIQRRKAVLRTIFGLARLKIEK